MPRTAWKTDVQKGRIATPSASRCSPSFNVQLIPLNHISAQFRTVTLIHSRWPELYHQVLLCVLTYLGTDLSDQVSNFLLRLCSCPWLLLQAFCETAQWRYSLNECIRRNIKRCLLQSEAKSVSRWHWQITNALSCWNLHVANENRSHLLCAFSLRCWRSEVQLENTDHVFQSVVKKLGEILLCSHRTQ